MPEPSRQNPLRCCRSRRAPSWLLGFKSRKEEVRRENPPKKTRWALKAVPQWRGGQSMLMLAHMDSIASRAPAFSARKWLYWPPPGASGHAPSVFKDQENGHQARAVHLSTSLVPTEAPVTRVSLKSQITKI